MKQIFLFTLSIVSLFLSFFSCNNAKTAQEYLREEKKAIERYIDRNGIEVVGDYLAAFENNKNGFAANKYFRTDDGLYIHVVDSGNGKRVRPYLDEVMVRFDYYFDIKNHVGGDTAKYSVSYTQLPFVFRYGIPGSYSSSYFVCSGWTIPLSYMGEGAIVDLIIPSSLGAQSDNTSYRPVFYKNLHYTKFK
jgi:FKBP-type peptidyl-prolyl cis-trans isomerase